MDQFRSRPSRTSNIGSWHNGVHHEEIKDFEAMRLDLADEHLVVCQGSGFLKTKSKGFLANNLVAQVNVLDYAQGHGLLDETDIALNVVDPSRLKAAAMYIRGDPASKMSILLDEHIAANPTDELLAAIVKHLETELPFIEGRVGFHLQDVALLRHRIQEAGKLPRAVLQPGACQPKYRYASAGAP